MSALFTYRHIIVMWLVESCHAWVQWLLQVHCILLV